MKLLIVSDMPNDFAALLKQCAPSCELLSPEAASSADIYGYDAIALLGGVCQRPLTLFPDFRNKLTSFIASGKPFFSEYCTGVGKTQMVDRAQTRFDRPVALPAARDMFAIARGTIMDEQCNDRLIVTQAGAGARALLQYAHCPTGFYRMRDADKLDDDVSRYALWLSGENHLICAFRFCNYARARFAPRREWVRLICGVASFLGADCPPELVLKQMKQVYDLRGEASVGLDSVVKRAIEWYDNAGMLMTHGGAPYAARESLSAVVHADGAQEVREEPRVDMSGMTAKACYLYGLYSGDEKYGARYAALMRYPKDMQIAGGVFDGMVRWCSHSWFACYPDDNAHGFLFPLLWHALLSGDGGDLPLVKRQLDFIRRVTGANGLFPVRIDILDDQSEYVSITGVKRDAPGAKWRWYGEKSVWISELRARELQFPSAHYCSYQLAAILFYGLLAKDKTYLDTGERGLTALMAYYPETAREHSETQELCRLILPLAFLYAATAAPEKKQWLYRVVADLDKHRHPSGGYAEWDTGYIACCAGVSDGESSVLAENGDPVADMLYSLSWATEGFAVAYYVTGDEMFLSRWQYMADFLRRAQIVSDNATIDGAWARAIDLDAMEVYGVPNDVAWAPWTIETGWMMGQYISGLLLGMMRERVGRAFKEMLDGSDARNIREE